MLDPTRQRTPTIAAARLEFTFAPPQTWLRRASAVILATDRGGPPHTAYLGLLHRRMVLMILTHPSPVLIRQGPSRRGGRRSRGRRRVRGGDGGDRRHDAGQRDDRRRTPFGGIGDLARPLRHDQWMQRRHGRKAGVSRAGVNGIQRHGGGGHEGKAVVFMQRRMMRRLLAGDLHPLIGGEVSIVLRGAILLHLHAHGVHGDVLHPWIETGLPCRFLLPIPTFRARKQPIITAS